MAMRVMIVDGKKIDKDIENFLRNLHCQNEVSKYEMHISKLEALERLELQDGEFDVLIEDIDIISMTGDHFSFIKEVKKRFSKIICIIHSKNDFSKEAERLGALFFFKSLDSPNDLPYILGMAKMAKEVMGARQ